ncbi:bis(5'-nucleosyl)-tetraphosphatase (symmetrical) YqeK [Alkalicoccobacillus gibsonii]|jgi:predicted HD superfamily hydrolase involved in NAD metabolism|uniref:bis(5'-nucleosyl)-tetraphosphatase (symmetrical) YqeK n=1 Tax=Alkalicoccobacillus gibsonii TaxID=79881 RepID=UPI0019322340|nr:bis(5'-nucleosyl)-tetraphosphatase (symmetrical) YqeK [Alkalicoccobacillus gibsonii]MBM0064282.1 bis(5'-nucleosyl)-tetraphosphatase (symmetrical) YqeK [Alkalicoccobacillus gibsonii]
MDQKQALELVKPHLTEGRYIHTVGVMETAIFLAEQYGEDRKKAETAAIFHDYAKYRDKNEMRELVKEKLECSDILDYSDELLHAPCGAYFVEHEIGITDQGILTAIASHTTGQPNMSLLEKIIFLADYIEPNRKMPGVEEVRELSKTNLDLAILKMLENTITFLVSKRQTLYPLTLETYNHFVRHTEGSFDK